MYKCLECGNLFEDGEQAITSEKIGECFGTPVFEEFSSCPLCGEKNYEEAKMCKICDEYHCNESEFCDDCYSYYKRDFKHLMSKTYSEDERKLINIIFEGDEL